MDKSSQMICQSEVLFEKPCRDQHPEDWPKEKGKKGKRTR